MKRGTYKNEKWAFVDGRRGNHQICIWTFIRGEKGIGPLLVGCTQSAPCTYNTHSSSQLVEIAIFVNLFKKKLNNILNFYFTYLSNIPLTTIMCSFIVIGMWEICHIII